MRVRLGKVFIVVVSLGIGLASGPVESAEQACMYGGNATPVTTNLTCAQQCDAQDYCRYTDGGTWYTYTECSTNPAAGAQKLCEKQNVLVSNTIPCVKDTAVPCLGTPLPPGCVQGNCASGSNIFQCKYKEDAVPIPVYADKWLPIGDCA